MSEIKDATRLKRPGWKDPRLVVGVLLVVLSIAAVVLVIRQADSRMEYWVAAEDLAPGATITEDQLSTVSVNLGDSGGNYLPADEPLSDSLAVVSTVRQGELLPSEGTGDQDPQLRQPATIEVSQTLPEGLRTGSRVDLWIAYPEDDGRGFFEPELVATGAEIAGMSEASGTFGTGAAGVVQLMLSAEELPAVLGAQANGAQMSLVPSLAAS